MFCFDDDNLIEKNYIEEMVSGFDSEAIGYVICKINNSELGIIPHQPFVEFKLGDIDHLNFMVRRRLAERFGWPLEYEADFYLIDKISKISRGNFIDKILGEYRIVK